MINDFAVDWPIGTTTERAKATDGYPGSWFTANPYDNKYSFGYHTGEDFNNNLPFWNMDKDAPIYACANGVVTFSGIGTGKTWGWLIIIEHKLSDSVKFYSRTAHIDHLKFVPPKAGYTVTIGQQIAMVGNADGYYIYAGGQDGSHLHFDISTTDVLLKNPSDWPGLDQARLLRDYVNPVQFILKYKTKVEVMPETKLYDVKVTTDVLNVRTEPNTSSIVASKLKRGDIKPVYEEKPLQDGVWLRISSNVSPVQWVAGWLTQKVVPIPPTPIPDVFTYGIIDLYHGNAISDSTKLLSAINSNDVVAIMHKASQGLTVDPLFTTRYAQFVGSLKTGFFGATHFGVGEIDPVKQANFFVDFVRADGKTPLALDVETNPDKSGKSMTPTQAIAFCNQVKLRTGKPCVIYTNATYWGDADSGEFPLWVTSQHTPPVLPSKFSTWKLQQYSQGTVAGIIGPVDLDRFNGSTDQLAAFFTSISGTLVKLQRRVSTGLDPLNIRKTPDTLFTPIGKLEHDVTVNVFDDTQTGSGLVWRKLADQDGYVADKFLTDNVVVIPDTSKVIADPGANIQGTITDHKLLQQFIDDAKYLWSIGRPLGACVWIDLPDYAAEMAKYTKVIFRNFPAGDAFDISKCDTPEHARDHAQFIYNWHRGWMMQYPAIQYHQLHNEKGVSVPFEIEAMRLAKLDGKKLALFGDSTQTPTLAEWKTREAVLRIAMADGHIIAKNEYSAFVNGQPSSLPLTDPATEFQAGLQHRELYAAMPADCKPKLVIAETQTSDDINRGADALIKDMSPYLAELRKDDFVIAFCPFVFGRSTQNAAWELTSAWPEYVKWVATT